MIGAAQPALDELEVSLFGPGFGEAVVVHLGGGQWMLVDSCWLDKRQLVPVSSSYLDQIGVHPNQVRHIVASHWHDDHVGGISVLVDKYTNAEFSFPSYLAVDEGKQFLLAFSGSVEPTGRGTRELYRAIRSIVKMKRVLLPLHLRTILAEADLPLGKMRAVALSPSGAAWATSMAAVQSKVHAGLLARNVAEPKTNISSVVIHIDFGSDAVLLGSDLEHHGALGWTATLADPWAATRPKASFYKVAHHGSRTACSPQIWNNLLRPAPVAALTPFINGKVRLPGTLDVLRIKSYDGSLSTTSPNGKNLQIRTEAERLLTSFLKNATGRSEKMGHLRYRKKAGAATWTCSMDGAAQKL